MNSQKTESEPTTPLTNDTTNKKKRKKNIYSPTMFTPTYLMKKLMIMMNGPISKDIDFKNVYGNLNIIVLLVLFILVTLKKENKNGLG